MKRKLFSFILMAFLVLPCAILLSACKQETKPQEPEAPEIPAPKTSVNITFASKYGDLEFASKELSLTNGFVYIQDEDLPTITNEGNDKIFDYWATADGEKFNFDLKVTDDVDLQAVFCYELEFVWEENWDLYDSIASYKVDYDSTIYVTEDGGVTNISSSWGGSSSYNPTFRKIKKSDCLDKYITKDEYNKLPNSACFVTNVYKNTIVTTEDFTTDTYSYYQYVFIAGSYYGQCCVINYIPKGVSLGAYSNSAYIARNYAHQIAKEEFGSQLKSVNYDYYNGVKNTIYLTREEFSSLSQNSYMNSISDSNYSYSDKDWQEDVYYALCSYNWIKFSCTLEDGSIKYFVLAEYNNVGGYKLYENITKEVYDSYTN